MGANGWIKLHRKLIDKGYYKNSQYVHLWVHLLLLANHKEHEFMWNGSMIMVKEGQIITGRKELSNATGIPETTIERILKMLENEHQIGQQKTNKYRVITILNWKEHQERTPERTTNGQQTDTYKNDKKEKKEIPAPEDGRRGITPTFGGEGEVESAPRAPRPVKTPVSTVIEIWNKYPNWKATGSKATPKNPSVIQELLPPAKDVKALNGVILKKRSKYSEEDFDHAIRQYASEVANRSKDAKGYYQHRFTLYEFLTRHDIFERYVTR